MQEINYLGGINFEHAIWLAGLRCQFCDELCGGNSYRARDACLVINIGANSLGNLWTIADEFARTSYI